MKFIQSLLENVGLGRTATDFTLEEERDYKQHLAKVYSIIRGTTTGECIAINLEDSIPTITKDHHLPYRAWLDLSEELGESYFKDHIHTAHVGLFPSGRYFLELRGESFSLILPGFYVGSVGERPLEALHILSTCGFDKDELHTIFSSNCTTYTITKKKLN